MDKQKILLTNEIASALLAKKCAGDKALLSAVKSDPGEALDMRETALQVRTVQNTADVLHVCVPSYEALNKVNDGELNQVSGGVSHPDSLGNTNTAAIDDSAQQALLSTYGPDPSRWPLPRSGSGLIA